MNLYASDFAEGYVVYKLSDKRKYFSIQMFFSIHRYLSPLKHS